MGQAMIEVRDLRRTFGAVEAVRGISFRVERGEIVGFLGPNGAGKTTTLRILAGIFPPTSGEVRIAGRDPARDPLACRRAVGYFPEYAPFYPDLRVEGYLRFVARMKRIPRAERARAVARVLASCGLDGVWRRRWPRSPASSASRARRTPSCSRRRPPATPRAPPARRWRPGAGRSASCARRRQTWSRSSFAWWATESSRAHDGPRPRRQGARALLHLV